jgi:predicted dehydrogenase
MKPRDVRENPINRREFLGSSAKNAAGMAAVGMVGLASAVSAKASPGERVSVAAIGIRGQGKELACSLAGLPDVDLTAICDVDDSLLPVASKAIEGVQGRAPRTERDFRRLLDDPTIDAVVIATPDHWHALMTILACQAGKDVYVEKPVSHNILEGERMIAAARKYGRIVQSGLQQRSGTHFQSAIEFVRSGKLGQVHLAKAWTTHVRKPIGRKKDGPVPQGVDYGLWLGPAPLREFNPNRFHYNWHWFWQYGTGELGNWGVHMLDVARWGLGVELPTQITAAGGKHSFDDDQQTPDTLLVSYSYPGKTITWEHRLWSNHGIEGRSAAAAFYGEAGTLVVDRGGWKVYDQKDSVTSGSSDLAATHQRNFVDCIKTRQTPIADIEIGHVSSTLCHLGNIAYRLGRNLSFDPAALHFGSDAAANEYLGREYRAPWQLPTV